MAFRFRALQSFVSMLFESRLMKLPLPLFVLLLALACVSLAADPAEPGVKVVLVGDSTVQSKTGWGDAFIPLLRPGVQGLNLGKGGRSSKSYRDEGAWALALKEKPAYILIQFGHNDQPGKGPARETDPKTTYPENLARFIDEARAIGAHPILVTPMVRRNFDPEGKRLRRDLEAYAEAVRRVGEEKNVEVVDLHARSKDLIEKLGPEGSKVLDADQEGGAPGTGGDRTHLCDRGAAMIAPLVEEELRRIKSDLAQYLK
jgi:lysophospholipase L1-like esterase